MKQLLLLVSLLSLSLPLSVRAQSLGTRQILQQQQRELDRLEEELLIQSNQRQIRRLEAQVRQESNPPQRQNQLGFALGLVLGSTVQRVVETSNVQCYNGRCTYGYGNYGYGRWR